MVSIAELLAFLLTSLQYSEIEKATHHGTVSMRVMNAALGFTSPRTPADTNVAPPQSATVLIQSVCRSDFNQNKRTSSQYPEDPIAEPQRKRTIRLNDFQGIISRIGDKIEPDNDIIGVAALQTAASMMKDNTLIGRTALRFRSETTIAVA